MTFATNENNSFTQCNTSLCVNAIQQHHNFNSAADPANGYVIGVNRPVRKRAGYTTAINAGFAGGDAQLTFYRGTLMKRKNNVSLLSAGLTALMLTMGTGQALAEDGKVYPASFCTPVNNNYADAPFSINAGEWANQDDFATFVECPIIKDSIGKGLRNGFVRVLDRNPVANKDVECEIISRRTHVFPHQGFSTGKKTSRSFDTSVQTLNFGPLGHNGRNTTYTMNCSVPGKHNGVPSRIMGYLITENS